jgi:hypothetical protein
MYTQDHVHARKHIHSDRDNIHGCKDLMKIR